MPRIRGKYKSYSLENLETAIQRVKNKQSSLRQASMIYGIPRTTLFEKISGKSPLITTQGPSPVLTMAEEEKLAAWLKNMSRIGYGQTRQQLRMMVKKILDEDGRRNPFTNNTPGNDWFRRFKKRHPGLSERVGESLGKERAMLTVKKLDNWFTDLENFLREEEGGIEIMEDPSRLFNCDESGFPLNGKTMRVLAPTGCKTVYQLTNSDKSQITVLACMNAAGMYVPPMLIFPGQRFKYNPLRGAPENWFLGRSESGWIDQEVFYEWLANHFVPSVKQAKIPFPVILFLDGHRSHINLETANYCAQNKVILYCFPAHASHILQPCDLSLFKSVKNCWKKEVQQWQVDNPGQNVTKQNFAFIFHRAWRDSASATIAANGFRAAGLYPFTKAFDPAKVAPSEIFQSLEAPSIDIDMPILSPVANIPDTDASSPPPAVQSRYVSRPHAQQKQNPAATMARKALETTFTPEKIWVYEKRFREGFDIQSDELYNTWKKLKLQEAEEINQDTAETIPAALSSPTRGPVLTCSYVSPFLERYLRYPKAPESRRPVRVTKELPKAISGRRYRQYLEDKQSAKEALEKLKKHKKEIREAKKLEKVKMLKEKEKRMGEARARGKTKQPVRRKLLHDLPQTVEETCTTNEDAGGVQIFNALCDTLARTGSIDEEDPADDSQLITNTLVSLGLDKDLNFPKAAEMGEAQDEMEDRSCGVNTIVLPSEDLAVVVPSENDAPMLQRENDGVLPSEGYAEEMSREEESVVQSGEQDAGVLANEGGTRVVPSKTNAGVVPRENDAGVVPREDDGGVPRENSTGWVPRENGTGGVPREKDSGVLPSNNDDGDTGMLPNDDDDDDMFPSYQYNVGMFPSDDDDEDMLPIDDGVDVQPGENSVLRSEEERAQSSELPSEWEVLPTGQEGVVLVRNVHQGKGPSEHQEAKEPKRKPKQKKMKMKMMKKAKKKYYEEESFDGDPELENDDWTQIDENVCDVCEQGYCDNDDDWVGCEWCPRWFHKGCTDIADIHDMSDNEIHGVDWYCHHCM